MYKSRFILVLAALIVIPIGISCVSSSHGEKDVPGYSFKEPQSKIILPDTLHEISGVTCIDSLTLGCIQDENGILFIYDLEKREIKSQFTFELDGDYEGLAKVNNDMYVLRSDGAIFEVNEFQ